ncbi:hypothetical protein B0H19DRAFT_1322533 [Mycena capillaripes]|nr:hypothetical protein B0H19DRAFT_1322533 [Mycena capillaripes]
MSGTAQSLWRPSPPQLEAPLQEDSPMEDMDESPSLRLPQGSNILHSLIFRPPSPMLPDTSPLHPRLLSPLILPSRIPSPSPSPLTLVDSRSSSLSPKRTSGVAGFTDSPRRSKRKKLSVEAVDDDDDQGDTDYNEADSGNTRSAVARLRGGATKDCPRGANRKRVSRRTHRIVTAATVAGMRAQLESQPSTRVRGKGKGRGGKLKHKERVWMVSGQPQATREGALRIVGLGMVPLSVSLQRKLTDFLLSAHLLSPQPNSTPVQSLSSTIASPSSGFVAAMSRRQTRGGPSPTYFQLASEVKNKTIDSAKIGSWYSAGTRLAYLAAASSMYIVPLIAACGWRSKICKDDWVDLVEELGFLLCSPHPQDYPHVLSKDCGDIVRTLIVPQMVWLKQVTTELDSVFILNFPTNSEDVCETIRFSEVQKMAAKLRSFNFNYFALPPLNACWAALENPLLAPTLPLLVDSLDLTEDCVAEQIVLKTNLNLKATPCPVTPENSESWTANERAKLRKAHVVNSLEDLEEHLEDMYDDKGQRKDDSYLMIAPEIAEGRVLTIRDNNDGLVAMVITNISETLPHLEETATTMMSAILEGEVYEVDSSLGDHQYCATHKTIWSRYMEQGDGAPEDVHPNFVQKEGVQKTNYSQRAPLPSQEMKEEPEETEQLSEFIQLVTLIIELHLKKHLKKEYDHIRVFTTRLPLNERSRAHPFGGFVINIAVSTRGHRDAGDKIFCVVIPFGKWEGGELGLYETGFGFRLRPWDAIIFPSGDITHFNQHFKGIRFSLILHSDKHGDQWIRFHNGWSPRDCEADVAESIAV